MATITEAIKYKGNVLEFPLENPDEHDMSDDELHENLARPSTERTKRLKARCRYKHTAAGEFIDPNLKAGIERMRYLTEAHKNL